MNKSSSFRRNNRTDAISRVVIAGFYCSYIYVDTYKHITYIYTIQFNSKVKHNTNSKLAYGQLSI